MFEMKCTRRHDPERGPENWLRRSKPETRNPKGLIGTTLPSEFLDDLHPGKLTTSSTAQGGGGSLKNRKPIGELGCCESGMAERSH